MSVVEMDVIEKLDEEDKEKIAYFASLLMRQTKYRHLKKEIEERREEIKQGETLTHSEIWDSMNV
ncbi:MAG TPA: hypothetical protein ENK32_09885 [Anaerolineae bacterium]|nr:hypothetical protein [Anaerolineae bacterium]